jgi:hypothetical protein
MSEAGDGEVPGIAGIGGQPRHVPVVGAEFERVDALVGAIEDDEPPAQRVERVPEQSPVRP